MKILTTYSVQGILHEWIPFLKTQKLLALAAVAYLGFRLTRRYHHVE